MLEELARGDLDLLRAWAAGHGLPILVVVVAALIAVRLLDRAIPAAITRGVMIDATPLTERDLRKRADTLTSVLLGAARIAVLLIALLMVVGEFGVNVVPLIAGLGIGGIAIGLGAQSLVRDAINGILILTENQFGKGDMVTIAGVQGWVEEVNLRRTVLRDLDGTLHSVPNGEIKVASNLTRGFSGVNLLVTLAPTANVDAAIALINRIGEEIAADPGTAPDVIQAPQVARVETTSAAGIDVRVMGRVAPGAQWSVASALRRRIAAAFEERGLRLGPFQAPGWPPTTSPTAPPLINVPAPMPPTQPKPGDSNDA